jgi:hypothetical protein
MAQCPICAVTLPEPAPPTCPNCGAVLGTGAAAAGPPPLPPTQETAAPPPLPERDEQERTEPEQTGHHALDTGGFEHPPDPPLAWDERDRLGFAAAFVETTRQVLTGPTEFFRRMPVTGGLGGPLFYAVTAGWIGLVAAALYQSVWVSIVGPSMLPFGMEREEFARVLAFMESWAGLVAQVVFGGISVTIGVFVTSGILHLMLMLLGGGQKTFEATFRAVCFAQAPMLLFVIPVFLIPGCGLLVGLWSLVLYVIGLAGVHEIGHGRAAAAVLLPLLALCCCCAGFAFTLAGAIASLARHAS